MPPIKVVLDTNVLLSGILFGGNPRELLFHVIQGRLLAFLSPAVFMEFKEVLARAKFGLTAEECFVIANAIEDVFIFVFPRCVIERVEDDPDDNRVLECAVTANVDYLITGDPHLLRLESYEQMRIVSPATFINDILRTVGFEKMDRSY
jgi:uncharacterized protein